MNVAYEKREAGIIFAIADETENMELIKRFNLQDSGEEINVGCVGKGTKNKNRKYFFAIFLKFLITIKF